MYQQNEDWLYYITLHNENYKQPAMPEGVEEGIVRGIYKLSSKDAGEGRPLVQLFGSGAILREALRAQEMLAERYQVSSNVWSVTSYKELYRHCIDCERWNMLHPTEPPRTSFLEQSIAGHAGPFIAASDNVRGVAEHINNWVPGGLYVLGTDGFGRSEARSPLRRHFEVDAESIVVASLYRLAAMGQLERSAVAKAIADLGLDAEKKNPFGA
jgi:pyruvate dehydrogenase E1 component